MNIETWLYPFNFKKPEGVKKIPYGIVEQLLQWHFDIYNLIENGLAIDLTTINHKNHNEKI